jgi:hypothetical protein
MKNNLATVSDEDIFISDEKFNTYLNSTMTSLVEQLKKTEVKQYAPTLQLHSLQFLEDEEGAKIHEQLTIMILADFDSDHPVEYMRKVAVFVARERLNVIAAFLFSEAWLSANVANGKYKRAEFDPQRKEAVVVGGMTLDSRTNLGRVALLRDEEGYIRPGELEVAPYVSKKHGAQLKHYARIHNPQLLAFFETFVETVALDVLQRGGDK